MANIINSGVGRIAREVWSRNRPTPEVGHQTVGGFYIGRVMDDCDSSAFGKNDGQCMGRLWVYIPNFSSLRQDAVGKEANLGREAPPKDKGEERRGWIICYPLFPFFGSDDIREKDTERKPYHGESNTYGMWYQPRRGDMVGILFAEGDPAKGYWIGCVPRQYQNQMVPGVSVDTSSPAPTPTPTPATPTRTPAPSSLPSAQPPSGLSPVAATTAYIRSAAIQRGIDPEVAVAVAKSEGLNGYIGDNGSRFGPYQLHYGGVARGGNSVSGLGDDFTRTTGLDARNPATVNAQIDYALTYASQHGWGPWHGWKGDPFAGIGTPPSTPPTQVAQASTPTSATPTASSPKTGNPVHEQNILVTGAKQIAKVFQATLTDAGLIKDVLRGARTSSSRRESPSRIFGIKTPGDPDLKWMGHQIVLDDHPDFHGVRVRTSKGNQVYFSDTAELIYMNTAKGNVWMEFDDKGHVHIFRSNSISFHTMKDFNFTAEGDLNLDIRGNVNWRTAGTTVMEWKKDTSFLIGETQGDLNIETKNNTSLLVHKDLKIKSDGNSNLHALDDIRIQSNGKQSYISGDEFRVDGLQIYLNSGAGANADNPGRASLIHLYALPGPPADCPPTRDGPSQKYSTAIVPQHEPWSGHTPALAPTPAVQNLTFASTLPQGSSVPGATAPNNVVGKPTPSNTFGTYSGNPYSNTNAGAPATYTQTGSADPVDPHNLSMSDQGLANLTKYEGHSLTAYPDAGKGYSIGYGHLITPADGLGPGSTISEDQAQLFLLQDTQKAQNLVRSRITQPITQEQFDSLTRLAYNCPSALNPRSSVVQAINSGNFRAVPNSWMQYVNARPFSGATPVFSPGLYNRRQQELSYAGFTPASI